MTATTINLNSLDSSVDHLSNSVDRFRSLAKDAPTVWALKFLCWAAARRTESLINNLEVHFVTLTEFKEAIEAGDIPAEAIDKDFTLSDHILNLQERITHTANKLREFRSKMPTSSTRTIQSIDRSLSVFDSVYATASAIRWEIGVHDAAFMGRAGDLSGESAEEIQRILEKISAAD